MDDCDSISLDKQLLVDNKKRLHPKCAKLQKHDEESWISGEELQTDDSSDEDQSIKLKKQLQQSNDSINNSNNLDKQIKEHNLKRQQSVEMFNRIKMKSLNNNSVDNGGCGDNNNNCHRQSSESLTESLNLENRWRPKRGSLKLSNLKDDGSGNVEELQKSIQKLSVAIEQNDKLLKIEQNERKKIHQLLQEIEATTSRPQGTHIDLTSERDEKIKIKSQNCRFIKRNIEVSRQPTIQSMIQDRLQLAGETSNFPLTDDEKNKLKRLLSDLDSMENCGNAYRITEKNQARIAQIDENLQFFL